ncbi:hypothetical protein WAG26_26375 [Bacillus cereus]|uniref:hypothetical protein n=1 Tax=Bacillus cereus TaxID=1396 RepID=UPI003012AEEC
MNKRKIGKKINGSIGFFRALISSILLSLLFMGLIILSAWFKWIFVVYLVISISYYYCLKFSDRYHIRPIRNTEYKKVVLKKLIHYTDYMDELQINHFEKTGLIKLIGNSNAKASYRMKRGDKDKNFVWFHTESDSIEKEPDFDSFAESHIGEGTPRKYKIIIDAKHFKKEELFFNPVNGNVLALGDVEVSGEIYEDFEWYNKKLYLWDLIKGTPETFLLFCPVFLHQIWGVFINFINKLKRKKK